MKRSLGPVAAGIALAAASLLLLGGGGVKSAAASSGSADVPPAEAYCTDNGGVVETRVPYFGTNNSNPLRLAGARRFCQFTLWDGSRIHVLLATLYATEPSLAALAYYAKVPINPIPPGGGNPASFYCTQLGGSDLVGGANLAGGGWVEKGTIDETLEACIFPDMSSIDSWGLAYHSNNIIRGKNLGKVLRYHP